MGNPPSSFRGTAQLHTNEISTDMSSLELYTNYFPLLQRATFWHNMVTALTGSQDLLVPDDTNTKTYWPREIVSPSPSYCPERSMEPTGQKASDPNSVICFQ